MSETAVQGSVAVTTDVRLFRRPARRSTTNVHGHSTSEGSSDPIATPQRAQFMWELIRIAVGWTFLWAFVDIWDDHLLGALVGALLGVGLIFGNAGATVGPGPWWRTVVDGKPLLY